MLGLADPEISNLRPDYRLSLHETLIAAARCVISKNLSLDLLSACQNPDRLHGLPSWVPNLLDDWKPRLSFCYGRWRNITGNYRIYLYWDEHQEGLARRFGYATEYCCLGLHLGSLFFSDYDFSGISGCC